MTTLRAHDQYNTTIYGLDDRYRGISGRRDVVFLNAQDLAAMGLAHGDAIADADGVEFERDATGLADGFPDQSADLVQMGVAGDDFDKRVDDRNERLVKVLVGEVARPLGTGLVVEDVVDIEHPEVGHLLFRHDGDGRPEVLDPGVEAGAGHGVRGVVAVVGFAHLKGRK